MKYGIEAVAQPAVDVAPLAGAWIEIINRCSSRHVRPMVAPLAGAWIEIPSPKPSRR